MDDGNPLKMKVTELKSELGKRGLSQTGLKFDLAQRLQTAMDVDEFGALPSLARPTPSIPSPAPSSNPNGRPASFVDSCDDQTHSLPPVAAAVQGSPKHEEITPQRPSAESTRSPNSTASETLAARRTHDGEVPTLDARPAESISVMWGGDGRTKELSRTVVEEKREATINIRSATPTKRDKEPIGKERRKVGAGEDSETQKIPCARSTEETRCTPAVVEELCAEMVYQLETDKDREGDSGQTKRDPTQNRVEPVTEMTEVPPLQSSAGRGGRSPRRKPGSNMGGISETANELDKTVIGRSERRVQRNDGERADTGARIVAELLDESSGVTSQNGCADMVYTTPSNLSPRVQFFVSPFSEIDKMKDREERFGQPNKTNHPDCSEPSCDDTDVHTDGRCASGRTDEGSRSDAVYLEVTDTVTSNDTWEEKLLKRKTRFQTPPLDRSRMKVTSEPVHKARSPAAGEAAAKMARRTERFAATSSGSSARLVTAPAGTPDPRGGSFTPPSSVKMVATLQQAAAAAGGNPDDPLPRRRKRVRARNSALGTILAPAKRSANSAVAVKRGDEGRITLANALVKPSTVVGTPDKRSPETRGATKTKKSTKQRARVLPAISTSEDDSPSVSPRSGVAALASPSPSHSVVSPSSTISPSAPLCFERIGEMPRPFSTEGCKTPPKRVGKGYMDKKAADQASKMRDRQRRFAQDNRTTRESTAC